MSIKREVNNFCWSGVHHYFGRGQLCLKITHDDDMSSSGQGHTPTILFTASIRLVLEMWVDLCRW